MSYLIMFEDKNIVVDKVHRLIIDDDEVIFKDENGMHLCIVNKSEYKSITKI